METTILRAIVRAPQVAEIVKLLTGPALDELCDQPSVSSTLDAFQICIKKLVLPSIRKEWTALQEVLQSLDQIPPTPNGAFHLLLQLGKVCERTELCHKLLSLPSTERDPRQRDRVARRLSVRLYIPNESEYARTKLRRWVDELNDPHQQLQLGSLGNLTILADNYLEQLDPAYIYPRLRSVYKACSEARVKGSYGSVAEVESMPTRRHFAMKTFQDVYFSRNWDEIRDELVILQVCNHKNLLHIVDAFTTKDTEMNLVFGPWAPYSLHKLLYSPNKEREKQCSWFRPNNAESTAIIFRLMYGLADGLQFLHDISIKHKDIKPSNILLYLEGDSDNIRPILADVGKSKVSRDDATTLYTDSTRMFLAPEQVDKQKSTLQADVWQLGCCFASLLALACGGTEATHSLRNSVIDPPGTQGVYSIDYKSFMAELNRICGGVQHISKALVIVKSMLAMESESRPSIHQVFGQFSTLV
ncbi:hypothetical protein NUW58_g2612 [Xylaria curta]|uniref:Uncharacterized protein n=2 Tax=Xylaria curta TaxID=42375 RepID=A0ACC1PH39_9PEZI|nr:hypothetical protein NUW58_g4166 [Xylaria curta]KAJ2991185.1 hypothetical protein NUW58_g2612 [Xylaria curta]